MKRTPFTRRAILATGAAAVGAGNTRIQAADIALEDGTTILFQGDSITDARRDRNAEGKANDPGMLGRGYPFHIAGGLLSENPTRGLKIYNRGISGNKVPDLDKRWQKDALDLEPDILSILIGVNDIWHKLNGKYDGSAEIYRDGFAALLDRTRAALPQVKLVVCEPFVLRCGAVNDSWFPEFETRRAYAAEVAEKTGALWVPFQQRFDEAVDAGTKPEYWAADGVHPSHAGHALMAQTWRESVGI